MIERNWLCPNNQNTQRCAFTRHGLRYVNKQTSLRSFTLVYDLQIAKISFTRFVYHKKKIAALLNVYLPSPELRFIYQKFVYLAFIYHHLKWSLFTKRLFTK